MDERAPRLALVSWAEWTAIGALATACFTLATAVIGWRAYRHGQAVSGTRNPLVVEPPKYVGTHGAVNAAALLPSEDPSKAVAVVVYIFNRSDARETFVLNGPRCRILSPKQPGITLFLERRQQFDPHEGGNVQLKVSCSEPWKGDADGSILLVATAHSGQKIHKKVRVRFEPAPGMQFAQMMRDEVP